MRKILFYAAISAITLFAFGSCSTEKEFNKEFLYDGDGRWASTDGVHFIFEPDGSGKWWNVAEDVPEEDAKNIQWSISGERYTYRRWMEIPEPGMWGANQDFTILDLTATIFKYQNASGRVYTFQKDS